VVSGMVEKILPTIQTMLFGYSLAEMNVYSTFQGSEVTGKTLNVYLFKKVDDTTIWPFVLWNQFPLNKVINDIMDKCWNRLYIVCKQNRKKNMLIIHHILII